jgi:hypothetical protein
MSGEAVLFEFRQAMRDAQAAAREYGNPVTLHLRQAEAGVSRDAYHGIYDRAGGADFPLKSPQIDYTPTKRQLEKAGLREDCEAVVWLTAQDLEDAGIDFNGLEQTRTTVTIGAIPGESGGAMYQLREKSRASPFANGYLHRTLGLTRRG